MRVDGSVALVTGANKGIGREISRQLAGNGVLVLMGARDSARGRVRRLNFAVKGSTSGSCPST
jgi:NAD(P)-dependent dehydrogenase (short-subunit alcohol dehydrogenase family)